MRLHNAINLSWLFIDNRWRICALVHKAIIILDDGLSHLWCLAIIWANACVLFFEFWGQISVKFE